MPPGLGKPGPCRSFHRMSRGRHMYHLARQISPDKSVNCHCATAPFTVSPEPWASLCCANFPGDSALYDVSVRRLTILHSDFLQTGSRDTALVVG